MAIMKRYWLFLFLFSLPLLADDFYSFESTKSLENSKTQIEEILKKIDNDNFKMIDETLGFHYGWISRWLSPFNYKVYLTRLEKNPQIVIIRVEGSGGDALSLRSIFYHEKLHKEDLSNFKFYQISEKSHFFGQTLNLVHPVLGILYAGYDSPSLVKSQMWTRSIWYFALDTFLIWAGGRNWFRSKWDPAKYSANIVGSMLFVRTISGIQNANLIRGHNRFVRLGYTFPLDLY
jgi:hypothetical protein